MSSCSIHGTKKNVSFFFGVSDQLYIHIAMASQPVQTAQFPCSYKCAKAFFFFLYMSQGLWRPWESCCVFRQCCFFFPPSFFCFTLHPSTSFFCFSFSSHLSPSPLPFLFAAVQKQTRFKSIHSHVTRFLPRLCDFRSSLLPPQEVTAKCS